MKLDKTEMLERFGSSPRTTLFLVTRSSSVAVDFLFTAALVILTQISFSVMIEGLKRFREKGKVREREIEIERFGGGEEEVRVRRGRKREE